MVADRDPSSNMFPRLTALTPRLRGLQVALSSAGSGCRFAVDHDRQNRRFTVRPGSGSAAHECAVLSYSFIGDKEVDLMSTYVPEALRGQGVAALLSQAAVEFLVEGNLKARVSCWYIQKYMEEHPQRHFKDLIIS
ncbi:protein NATD1-like isoform X2 [Echeneis naucrates]|uniref:protein NATD1-like isoform X2 n=1 Tax=Echeneis naucrates TaxID=173247 RepID=UPI00111429FA|nr:protein NATD1-like isoform X2 [Echeneis naucrates]